MENIFLDNCLVRTVSEGVDCTGLLPFLFPNYEIKEDIFYDNDFELETNIAINNEEDVNDLPNCRKKMEIFRDSIDNKSDHSFNEEEQIEDILEGKKK